MMRDGSRINHYDRALRRENDDKFRIEIRLLEAKEKLLNLGLYSDAEKA